MNANRLQARAQCNSSLFPPAPSSQPLALGKSTGSDKKSWQEAQFWDEAFLVLLQTLSHAAWGEEGGVQGASFPASQQH